MFLKFWRSLRGKKSVSTLSRIRSSTTHRTVLSVESLESRDLLSGFSPTYILESHSDSATPYATSAATGYSPAQISQAYGFNQISFNNGTVAGNGSGQTIAIVDAYNQPDIASDLRAFDAAFGLPAPPSFTVVNQSGGGNLPAANSSWGMEESLDVEWAHAMAPGANIVLVEANGSSESDLFSAVQYAASIPGVSVVSMSWGGGEFSSESDYDSIFTTPAGHQGVAFVASAGDSGAPPSYPAVSPNVLAVGGTTLNLSGSSYGSESAWSGSGGGISTYEPQPSYQNGVVSQSSTQRTSPDVAYDANPNTGVSVYDSYGTPAGDPWIQVGGTSTGAPQWAALVAIADQGRALNGLGTLDGGSQLLPMLYQLPSSDFHDVTTGTSTGSPNYSAGPGYDLVTGLGSPYANRIVAALSEQTLSGGTGNSPTGTGTGTGTGSSGSTSPVLASPPAGSGVGSSPISFPITLPTIPQPSSSDPFTDVAMEAFYIVQGWESQDYSLLLVGWNDLVDTLLANYPEAIALEQAA
ncbi:MAG TPA: S53 family peptidase, partial [Terriglobia bacterium]|nr:S53 family peptidase [Terriglobia bacterium]